MRDYVPTQLSKYYNEPLPGSLVNNQDPMVSNQWYFQGPSRTWDPFPILFPNPTPIRIPKDMESLRPDFWTVAQLDPSFQRSDVSTIAKRSQIKAKSMFFFFHLFFFVSKEIDFQELRFEAELGSQQV